MRPSSPTFCRTSATACSTNDAIDQEPAAPHTRNRKLARISLPRGVWATSGWNCTQAMRRASLTKAAAGELGLSPTSSKPGGSAVTRSPCDIHTDSSSPARKPRNRPSSRFTVTWARPYSCLSAGCTSPPSSRATSCAP